MNLAHPETSNKKGAKTRRILVTTALPYANGSLHLGHIFEGIYADIWVRYQKLRGHEVYFFCADDTHGTPIMVEARKRGLTPDQLIEQIFKDHISDYRAFQIDHTHYSSTHSKTNESLIHFFYERLHSAGLVEKGSIEQLFCTHDQMFLPDRFVKGTCPSCGATDQYGDCCDTCGATYTPKDLKQPACSICGNTPELKQTEQVFIKLEPLREFLQTWIPQHTSDEVNKKMQEWFKGPLRRWDISRNGPYFGFKIPNTQDKFFYVWMDAPMGYISTSKEFWSLKPSIHDEFWLEDKISSVHNTEVYHLIGKDIVYFHTLFWPALLKTAGFRLPSSVWVHGFIKLGGAKMSKSRGIMISVKKYLEVLDPSYLRYYFATKANSSVEDMDFSLEEFCNRVNSELIGKMINLGSRSIQMVQKRFESNLADFLDQSGVNLLNQLRCKAEEVAQYFENRDFHFGMQTLREMAELANQYFDQEAPWKRVESDSALAKQVLTTAVNAFRIIMICLSPVIPTVAEKSFRILNEKSTLTWSKIYEPLLGRKLSPFEPLIQKIEKEALEKLC